MEQTDPEPDSIKPYGQQDYCDHNPEFAVICSYVSQFGEKIGIDLNIEQLENSIQDTSKLDESLIELHIKLLKKIRRYFVRDQWEKALIRFASEYSFDDAVEIESLGYQKTRPSIKLELLRRLLDAQFECDQKFKAAVNLCEADELRILPIGRDIKGNTYWQRSDNQGNIRIFQEQPLEYKSWKTVCKNTDQLNQLINDLEQIKDDKIKGEPMPDPYNPLPEIFPELFKIEEKTHDHQIESKNAKSCKKGRSRGRCKKASPLPCLKEVDEEKIKYNSINSNHDSYNNSTENINFELNHIHSQHINLPNNSPNSDNASIESQVKSTVEGIINKVVSSIEFLVAPFSNQPTKMSNQEEAAPTKQRKRPIKREKAPVESIPRRSSSRIQQLQLKKIAEQEEEMKKMIESNANKKISLDDDDSRSRNSRKRSGSPEEESKKGRRRRKEGQTWRRGKGKKKLSWDKDDSDLSCISSGTDSNAEDLDDDYVEFGNNNYDDEFACEEEDTNIEPVIVKRARTARQSMGADDTGDLNSSSILEEDKPCGRCDKSNDAEWILLCDMCDDGYHTACCIPPLMIVPDGDWFCPPCEHKTLLNKLRELYASIVEILAAKERERQKRQTLRQPKKEPAQITDEIVSKKRNRNFLHELNDPIALQELDNELEEFSSEVGSEYSSQGREKPKKNSRPRKPARKNKKYEDDEIFTVDRRSRKTYMRREISESEESEGNEFINDLSESSEDIKPKTRRARASVSYRFQEYDELIKSAIRGDSDDDGASEKESVESEKCNYGRGKDMATIEALAYQQENDLGNTLTIEPTNEIDAPQRPKNRYRKKKRRLNDLDAESETEGATSDESFLASATEEEEEEEEEITEIDTEDDTSLDEIVPSRYSKKRRKQKKSGYFSDDSDYVPNRSRRRAAAARVSYKESTDEDDDNELVDTTRKVKKNVLSSDEETEASWRSSQKSPSPEESASGTEQSNDDDQQESDDEQSPKLVIKTDEIAVDECRLEEEEQEFDNTRVKKIRLERRETRPVVSMDLKNESFDEIAAPLYTPGRPDPLIQRAPQPAPSFVGNKFVGGQPVPNIDLVDLDKSRDPMEQLNQYCMDGANQTTMYSSFNEILSNKGGPPSSPPHPSFYDEDEMEPSSF